jgi:predicted membrane protein
MKRQLLRPLHEIQRGARAFRTNVKQHVSPLKQEHGILLLAFFKKKASPLFVQIWQVFTGSRRT